MASEPHHHEGVTLQTWPHSLSRFSILRDFILTGESGDVYAKGSSEWVLMSMAERKFVSVRDHYTGSTAFSEKRCFEKKPRKTPWFDEGNRPVHTVVPSFSDIDENGHVNNAMYAKFVMDALSPDKPLAIKSFQIDYRLEALAGATLDVHTLVEDGRVLVKGVREDGETSFAAAIELASSDSAS